MSETTMTMTELLLLEKCRDIELLCKDLYDYFAVLYADDELAAGLWKKTAKEEENHAAQFTLLLRIRRDMPCLLLIDSAKVDSVFSSLQNVIVKVRSTPPKLVDALHAAIKIEKHLADLHIDCVVMFEDDSYRKLFKAMMANDKDHIASLQRAYDLVAGKQGQP